MALTHTDVLVISLGANCESETCHVNKPSVRELLKACEALADDLHMLHQATGISLDDWETARTFVEAFRGEPVVPNGA